MKKKHYSNGVVYSTNPAFKNDLNAAEPLVIPPQQQDLRIFRESKHRGGKKVTVITGYQGMDDELDKLAKMLKTQCGTGGTVKEGSIIIQGDFREKIFEILIVLKYKVKKAGG